MPAAIGGSSAGSSICDSASRRAARRASAAPRRLNASGLATGVRLIERLVAVGAPDEVGLEADDGIAPARGAALDRLQQEAHRLVGGELQVGGDGRLEVGDEARPHDLRRARVIALGEGGERRHRFHLTGPCSLACARACSNRSPCELLLDFVAGGAPGGLLELVLVDVRAEPLLQRQHVLAERLVGERVLEVGGDRSCAAPRSAAAPA